MSRKDGKFDFKRFSVAHHRSSMKVGVDGVLVGLWTSAPAAGNILDVGCGCGVIALIMAQRSPQARILAIDIDEASVGEAAANFRESPWSSRLEARIADFCALADSESYRFRLIVSNPPFFDSGVEASVSRRMKARHQGDLSPSVLVKLAPRLLLPEGRLALVMPAELSAPLIHEAGNCGLTLLRHTLCRGHAGVPAKRSLLEFGVAADGGEAEAVVDELILETSPGIPTEEYRCLGRDFYLKF